MKPGYVRGLTIPDGEAFLDALHPEREPRVDTYADLLVDSIDDAVDRFITDGVEESLNREVDDAIRAAADRLKARLQEIIREAARTDPILGPILSHDEEITF
jgi:hypothetical protein